MVDLNTLYTKIFPIGGVDDNNKYIDLTGDKISTVQLVEPSLGVSEFILSKKYMYDKNNLPYKYAYRIPMVSIEDMIINPVDITAFKLDYTGFLPTLMFEFMDTANSLLSTNVPKDGSIIKVYIGGQGDEMYYKPLRQDFILTSIRCISSSHMKYRVYGKLNVPYGYRKEAWCGGKSTAMQALFNISVWTGLGFATNFVNPNTIDSMNWRNDETGTYFDFMETIAEHACYSPNTFFTAFIDQYNVLNFVECHSLLSHGGKKTDVPAMIYNCYPPAELPKYEPGTEKTTRNQIPLRDDEEELNNSQQRLSYYFISNHYFFDGWSNYIESYEEISNGSAALSDGFRTHVKYSDTNTDNNFGFNICDFLIRPIDNLKRDSATQKIEDLPDNVTKESYIPLNLMQMNKKEYLDELSSVDNMTNVESFTNFGEVDSSNMFPQYYFAEVQNRFQMKCLKKCGLKLRLQNYNPAVTKFSRIWVDIYDDHPISNQQISKVDVYENDKGAYLEYKENKNFNVIQYDDEGDLSDVDGINSSSYNIWPKKKYNRSLSGWYVVTEIEIVYDPNDNNLKMDLLLNRIEFQPCFKSDYDMAKKAVAKYKNENLIEDIIKSM